MSEQLAADQTQKNSSCTQEKRISCQQTDIKEIDSDDYCLHKKHKQTGKHKL
jgi:hypothetical protein